MNFKFQMQDCRQVEEQCSVVAQALPSRSQCSYNVRETPREMCTTVDMVSFQVDIVDTLLCRYSRYLHPTSAAGGVRGGAQDGAGGHLRHQDEGDRAEGDLRGYRPAAAQVRSEGCTYNI